MVTIDRGQQSRRISACLLPHTLLLAKVLQTFEVVPSLIGSGPILKHIKFPGTSDVVEPTSAESPQVCAGG